MNKYLLLLVFLLTAGMVSAQKKSILRVIKSDVGRNVRINNVDVFKVYKGVFQQDNTVLSSDSAYFYTKANQIEAFGHVLITQGDTLNVFGDKLHYDGNTKIAIVTDNVRLIDKDATLTTNYFTYNTATKYGTYTGGGKLVNKDNTLTSKNGYYFASSRDAYFRYNVILNTADAIIKTDTLRYNSGSRIAYFYGPTNIYGKRDKDTLYTENGTYNTQVEQAFFGKKNLYKQGSKSLKGDSLFYDRLIGYGKAIKHVTFMDTEQKIILKGGLGEYFKKEERTLMTQHPYVVFVTEEKDTTKTDTSKKNSLALNQPKTGKVAKTPIAAPKNTMPVIDQAQLKQASNELQNALQTVPGLKDTVMNKAKAVIAKNPGLMTNANTKALTDSAKKTATKNMGLIPAMVPSIPKNAKGLVDSASKLTGKNTGNVIAATPVLKKDTSHVKRDSIFMTADTLQTEMTTVKIQRILREQRKMAGMRDTSAKVVPSIVYTKPVKYLDIAPLRMRPDTTVFHKNIFGGRPAQVQPKKAATSVKKGKNDIPKPPVFNGIDSVNLSQDVVLNDTTRIRILTAAHHAKIFKSDLQAKADSIFFSYADSVARMYYHPMIWAQGSQLSADTINMQMKHKQLDNLDMYPNSFIVNIEKNDSTHFNQVGGKKMRGFFKNGKLARMYVFGNAETIYFNRDSLKVTEMHRTISSKIRVSFRNNEPLDILWYVKPDARYLGIGRVKEEDKILRNFIWKPKDRPISKEEIINPPKVVPVKKADAKETGAKKLPMKPGEKDEAKPVSKDDTKPAVKNDAKPGTKANIDSLKIKTDTLKHTKLKTDTTTKAKPHEQAKQ